MSSTAFTAGITAAQSIVNAMNTAYFETPELSDLEVIAVVPFADTVDDSTVTISMDDATNRLILSPSGGVGPNPTNLIAWCTKSAAAGGTSAFVNFADLNTAYAANGITGMQKVIDAWTPAATPPPAQGGFTAIVNGKTVTVNGDGSTS
jgi:hypothetical protein